MYKCQYFGIKELVSPEVYNKFGDSAWMFFKESTLRGLDIIRETWQYPLIINNWASGGSLKQCGLRSNLEQIVKDKTKSNLLYLSSHCMGKGFDLHTTIKTNKKLWEHCYQLLLKNKAVEFKRIEDLQSTPTWVHIDEFQTNNVIFYV